MVKLVVQNYHAAEHMLNSLSLPMHLNQISYPICRLVFIQV